MPNDQNDFGDARGPGADNAYDERFNRSRSSELEYAYLPRWMPTRPRAETGFDRFMALLGAMLLLSGIVVAVARRFLS